MNVAYLVATYERLVLHGTRHLGGADRCRLLPPGADVADRIRYVVNTSTTISCCTYRHGDSAGRLFSPVGVILRSGYIVAAHEHDLGSTSDADGNRNASPSSVAIMDQVTAAISQQPPNLYNELLVRDHEQCGIYVCQLEPGYAEREIRNMGRFRTAVEDLGLPLYVLNGLGIWTGSFGADDSVHAHSSTTIYAIMNSA